MKKLGDYWKRGERNDGAKFWTLTDDRPEWLLDAVHAAHGSDLPDDWTYEECRAACDAIDDGSLTDDDSVHEHADSRVDVYTRDRFQWAADHCHGDVFGVAEDEDRDCGGDEAGGSTVDRLGRLQYFAIARIARVMLEAWEENQDAGDADQEAAESEGVS